LHQASEVTDDITLAPLAPGAVVLPIEPGAFEPGQFVAHFPGFNGSLTELASELRAERIPAADVPLLALARAVLARFRALRDSVGFDEASEALPQLAAVIELKARLLLPRPPRVHEVADDDYDEPLDDVLAGVEALAQLEGAIEFLRERRRERSRLMAAPAAPVSLPRKAKPLTRGLADLVEAARRRVRNVTVLELAIDRLTLPRALDRLRALSRKLGKFLFRDAEVDGWGERAVLFSALLEGIRAGELRAEQGDAFTDIEVTSVQDQGLHTVAS
jgi:segregation and condensation protein A